MDELSLCLRLNSLYFTGKVQKVDIYQFGIMIKREKFYYLPLYILGNFIFTVEFSYKLIWVLPLLRKSNNYNRRL